MIVVVLFLPCRASVEKKLQKKLASARIPERTQAQRKVMLFSHLHQYERELSISRNLPCVAGTIHPAILKLGLRYADGNVSGSNARCVALLFTLKRVIADYETPPDKELARDLDSQLKPYITFLRQCRTLSVSMGNAIRFLKSKINTLPQGISDKEAKKKLIEDIDTFVHHNVRLAARQVSITAQKKMRDSGEVILTYGCSSLIANMLLDAHANGKKFRVIVADGRPRFEGKELLKKLIYAGINCEYIQVSSVPSVMDELIYNLA